MNYQDLKTEYKLEFNSFDSWGSNINYMFRLCEYLHFIAPAGYVPDELMFTPGIGHDLESSDIEFFSEIPNEDIKKFLLVLNRYDRILRYRNEDY